ncbi:MAG: anhydro-N-acetylmuramic acid kinase [Candidatus Methylomirabilota bacterium]
MIVIGLMSGTSADGVDAALVEIESPSGRPDVRLRAFECVPYPAGLRQRILALASGGGVEELCHLNAYLGELFAEAALRVARTAGVPLEMVALIGSHGQTVQHLPEPRTEGAHRIRSTLQIGAPAVIAERTGITTIADFRPRDMAAGGEGAPLTPLIHHLLFSDAALGRVVLNLGGIANLTVLPAGCDPSAVRGFDTGPANVLLDEFVRSTGLAEAGYDRDGRLAESGTVKADLLEELMAHPFIRRPPPKSTGREAFGSSMVAGYRGRLAAKGIEDRDGLATLAAFTVQAVAENLRRFVLPGAAIRELIVMGGGAQNSCLVRGLAEALPGIHVRRAEALGFSVRAIEAVAFAVLAYLTAAGQAGNLPAVTGAVGARVLGAIVPGRNFPCLPGR